MRERQRNREERDRKEKKSKVRKGSFFVLPPCLIPASWLHPPLWPQLTADFYLHSSLCLPLSSCNHSPLRYHFRPKGDKSVSLLDPDMALAFVFLIQPVNNSLSNPSSSCQDPASNNPLINRQQANQRKKFSAIKR